MKRAVLLSALLASSSASADVVVRWAGFLEDASGPVDGPVTAVFVVRAAEVELSTQTEASLVVVGGELVVDLLVAERDDLELTVVINGDVLSPTTPLPIAHPRSARALRAEAADRALRADAVGDVTAPLRATDFAQPGGPQIPLGAVGDFPAAFLDGDDGLVFSAGDTIAITDGVVSVRAATLTAAHVAGNLASADLAAGTLGTSDFSNGGVDSSDLANLPVSAIADGSLRARNFGATAGPSLFLVNEPGCAEPLNSVIEQSTCTFTNSGTCSTVIGTNVVQGKLACDAFVGARCLLTSKSQCPIPLLGRLVFP